MTPGIPEQDRISECTIRIILEKVRSVMIDQLIPDYLEPEIFLAIVHIMNCTATALLDDTILYKEFMNAVDPDRDHKPYIGYLYILGYKAYILIPPEDRLRSRKLDPCAEIGILVGYKGEYIYRI